MKLNIEWFSKNAGNNPWTKTLFWCDLPGKLNITNSFFSEKLINEIIDVAKLKISVTSLDSNFPKIKDLNIYNTFFINNF